VPELPDIDVYIEALTERVLGQRLGRIAVLSPFVLRTALPPIESIEGRSVTSLRRIGKRIVLGFDGDLWLVIHLMVAGRLHWYPRTARTRRRAPLVCLEFPAGTLTMTEAGTKRRASLHLLSGVSELERMDPRGLEVLNSAFAAFRERITQENHTLKRALTDPHILSGIGNAFSDEILHRARLSPLALTQRLTDEEIARLHDSARATLSEWRDRLRRQTVGAFPEGVTAFREGMAVHGRYGQPCPNCGTPIQRIRYADNETNYCPRCQTEGRVLADRALSRLLKEDWPRTIEELERLRPSARRGS
jgi:formamidopyrimidine-DNA glycosylase